jgi:hypothetical protein
MIPHLMQLFQLKNIFIYKSKIFAINLNQLN